MNIIKAYTRNIIILIMNPTELLDFLTITIPKSTRTQLIQQCIANSIGKPCKLQLIGNEVLIGSLSKGQSLEDLHIKQKRNESKKIVLKNLVSMTLRIQIRKFKIDADISTKQKSSRKLQQ